MSKGTDVHRENSGRKDRLRTKQRWDLLSTRPAPGCNLCLPPATSMILGKLFIL